MLKLGIRTQLFALTAAAATLACSSTPDDAGSAAQGVTQIAQTPVNDQGQTGNCWLYATAAWLESLHVQANGDAIHYSPAYWFYWDLYEQLVSGARGVEFGGYWGHAGDLIVRYGLVPQGSFELDDAVGSYAAYQAMAAKLFTGVVPIVNGKRDPVLVRAALDDAFKLGDETRGILTKVFGADGTHTFVHGAAPGGPVLRAQDFVVRTSQNTPYGGNSFFTTLDRLFGDSSGGFADSRVGDQAWTAAYPPVTPGIPSIFGQGNAVPGRMFDGSPTGASLPPPPADPTTIDAGAPNPIPGLPPLTAPDAAAWRAFYKRIQRALNDGVPVPMAFSVIDADVNQQGRFAAGFPIVDERYFGGHEVLLSDYEITNVPGFGTLAAGTPASDAQKAASLSDDATVTFFRVKNSWGADWLWPQAGYNDLETGYLEQPIDLCYLGADGTQAPTSDACEVIGPQIWDVVLPPGY